MSRLAFVIPRYAASIGGGAETLMRALAIELQASGKSVEVFATCALDHRTWDNHYPAGEVEEDGLKVHRFEVDERNLDIFIEKEQKIARGLPLSSAEQIVWLRNSVNSMALYQRLIERQDDFDFFFFAPYLFGTTFWGSMLLAKKSVLVPCLHDEGYAYLPIMRAMFRRVKGVMWNAEPEATLAKEIYRLPDLNNKGFAVGMGFKERLTKRRNILPSKSYFLYSSETKPMSMTPSGKFGRKSMVPEPINIRFGTVVLVER